MLTSTYFPYFKNDKYLSFVLNVTYVVNSLCNGFSRALAEAILVVFFQEARKSFPWSLLSHYRQLRSDQRSAAAFVDINGHRQVRL